MFGWSGRRRWSRELVRLALIVSTLGALGCSEKFYSEVRARRGFLKTPTGQKLPLQASQQGTDHIYWPGWNQSTSVRRENGDMMTVRLTLTNNNSCEPSSKRYFGVHLHPWQESPDIRVLDDEAYYRVNRGPKVPVHPERAGGNIGFWRVDIPPPIAKYRLCMQGASLGKETHAAIKKDQGNTYTLHIPFEVDGQRWEHHLKFNIKAKSRWVMGVPGVP